MTTSEREILLKPKNIGCNRTTPSQKIDETEKNRLELALYWMNKFVYFILALYWIHGNGEVPQP